MRSRRRSRTTRRRARRRKPARRRNTQEGIGSMALKLSDNAIKQVKQLKTAQNLPENVFLRMGVKGGGCSGMSYQLEFDSELSPHDKEFDIEGVKVVCDKK